MQEIKKELAKKAETTKKENKLTKSMSIEDLIHALEAGIKKALPEIPTPERFTRMALSALNANPKLRECTQMSFLAALMNAAQLVLVNKNWTQILNFFTAKIGFLCNAMDFLIHPCLAGWSVSGIPRL